MTKIIELPVIYNMLCVLPRKRNAEYIKMIEPVAFEVEEQNLELQVAVKIRKQNEDYVYLGNPENGDTYMDCLNINVLTDMYKKSYEENVIKNTDLKKHAMVCHNICQRIVGLPGYSTSLTRFAVPISEFREVRINEREQSIITMQKTLSDCIISNGNLLRKGAAPSFDLQSVICPETQSHIKTVMFNDGYSIKNNQHTKICYNTSQLVEMMKRYTITQRLKHSTMEIFHPEYFKTDIVDEMLPFIKDLPIFHNRINELSNQDLVAIIEIREMISMMEHTHENIVIDIFCKIEQLIKHDKTIEYIDKLKEIYDVLVESQKNEMIKAPILINRYHSQR